MKNNFNLFTLFKAKQSKLKRKQKNYKQIIREIDKKIKGQEDFEGLYLQLMQIKAYGSLKKAGIDAEKSDA